MVNKTFTQTLLFSFILPLGLIAQRDYLVTVKGDTVTGQISLQQFGTVEQALVKRDKREIFSAINVREVFLKGIRYKPLQYAGVIKFMQILSDGYLSLLAFQPQGIMNYDGRLLQMRDGRMLELPTLGFKKQMSNFLKDNESLVTKIQDGTLDRKDLDKIIAEYNGAITAKKVSNEVQSQITMKQKSSLELLTDLKTEIEKSDLVSRLDVLDMMADLEEKIKSNKTVPAYLLKGIKSSLETKPGLLAKFDELIKVL